MVLEILLVEDDAAQVYLVRLALQAWRTPYNLHVVSSAEQALDFLDRKNDHIQAPRPHLALVDLNLPVQPGFVVLQAIKGHPELHNTAVMILSSSDAPSDVQKAVELHTDAYLQKPVDYEGIVRLFERLEAFWRMDVRFLMKLEGEVAVKTTKASSG